MTGQQSQSPVWKGEHRSERVREYQHRCCGRRHWPARHTATGHSRDRPCVRPNTRARIRVLAQRLRTDALGGEQRRWAANGGTDQPVSHQHCSDTVSKCIVERVRPLQCTRSGEHTKNPVDAARLYTCLYAVVLRMDMVVNRILEWTSRRFAARLLDKGRFPPRCSRATCLPMIA